MKRIAAEAGSSPRVASADAVADASQFSMAVVDWQRRHGRHALPWQNTRDAYRVWLSEIMLQQTQVVAVIPYYQKFLVSFPTVEALAQAPSEQIMAHWSGLGYYTRARNLHTCAKRVVAEYGGRFPDDVAALADLPGIGRSTAAAIAAFAYGTRAAILDGNVKRVFCRVFGVEGFPGSSLVERNLWAHAEKLLPGPDRSADLPAYTQGLMDLGATLCTRNNPDCARCPLAQRCVALATGRTAALPQRKPKKTVPERHVTMLLIVDRDQVLLEQRPDTGIWGGLLSLPEITPSDPGQSEQQVASAVARFGVLESCTPLTSFSHGFTHFKLYVTPCLVRLSARQQQIAQDGHVWHAAATLARAPLPAPIKKLLLEFFGQGTPSADLFTAAGAAL